MSAADLSGQYKSVADRLIDAALADNDGYAKLAYLCDRIGARLSGTPSLDLAIQWSVATMKSDGLSNVRVIPVKVPKWVRGAESAQLLAPQDKPLHMLGLGMSVGTPKGGITADFIHSVKTREKPFRDIELAVNTMSVCHLGGIAYRLQKSLQWDAANCQFIGDEEANRMVDRARREPWQL